MSTIKNPQKGLEPQQYPSLHIKEKVPEPGIIKFAYILIIDFKPKSDFKFFKLS